MGKSNKNGGTTAPKSKPEASTVVVRKGPMAFVTSSSVPVPDRGVGRATHYPWNDLKDGQSFFVPGKSAASMSTLASTRKKEHAGENYTVREVKDGEPWGEDYKGVSGCAVWRVPVEASA
jgi:hypothetical protein